MAVRRDSRGAVIQVSARAEAASTGRQPHRGRDPHRENQALAGGQVEPASILLPPTVSVNVPIPSAANVARGEDHH